MTVPNTFQTRDLDGMGLSVSHPDNKLTDAALGKMNRSVRVSAVPGAESSNEIDVVCQLIDAKGKALAGVRNVAVRSLAVTADKGDLAEATVAVGTLKKAVNPTTGENVAWFQTTAAGLFSVKVANDAAEDTLLTFQPEDGEQTLLVLVFT